MARLSQPPRLEPRWRHNIEDHVIDLDWSSDGLSVAAASVSGAITILDGNTGHVKQTLQGHGFGTTAISWHSDNKRLASVGQDAKLRVWDTTTGSELWKVDGGSSWVEHVLWHPKGDILASAAGKKLRLWSAKGELLRNYVDQPATIHAILWGPKAKELISGGYGGATFWDLDQDQPVRQFDWKGVVLSLALTNDGKFLAAGAQENAVHFWYMKSGEDLEMSGYPLKVKAIAWDAGSCFLATTGGHIVTVWDCAGKGPAGSTPAMLEWHIEPITALEYQRRGPLLASGCVEGKIVLWYPEGSKKPMVKTDLEEPIAQLQWSPNDVRLIVGGDQGTICMYAI